MVATRPGASRAEDAEPPFSLLEIPMIARPPPTLRHAPGSHSDRHAALSAAASAAVALPGSLAEQTELYAQLGPLIRRLLNQYGPNEEREREVFAAQLYGCFCKRLVAYAPSCGVPLLPHLARSLSAEALALSAGRIAAEEHEPAGPFGYPAHQPTIGSDEWGSDSARLAASVLKSLPAVVASLPGLQRQVLVLRYYEGISFDEIAERLSIPAESAQSLLRHGLDELRQQIDSVDPALPRVRDLTLVVKVRRRSRTSARNPGHHPWGGS
jgi:hypothetical protein